MHAAVLEAVGDDEFAASFEDAGGDAQALTAEGGVPHALAVAVEVGEGLAGLITGAGVGGERGEEIVEVAAVEIVASAFAPWAGEVGSGAVEGLGDLEERGPSNG